MIVVTGASGQVGRLVATELAARAGDLRLVVRDPARAPDVPGAEVVAADYGDPESLARALHPGDRVFMVSIHDGPERRLPLHRGLVEAAAERRVAQVVYLSFVNAGLDATFLHGRSHGETERMLADAGVPFTAIRNSMYADEIPGWFDPEGVIRVPGGEGRMSFSHRPELARAIAVALTTPGREGCVYDVTTPQSVSMWELARIATAVTGDVYRYQPYDEEHWLDRWRSRGRPDWAIEAGLTSYAALREGEFDVVGDGYRVLTGAEPLTVAELISGMAAQMPLAGRR
jgi:NAD(P)H dehydrogenase (quinone)